MVYNARVFQFFFTFLYRLALFLGKNVIDDNWIKRVQQFRVNIAAIVPFDLLLLYIDYYTQNLKTSKFPRKTKSIKGRNANRRLCDLQMHYISSVIDHGIKYAAAWLCGATIVLLAISFELSNENRSINRPTSNVRGSLNIIISETVF